MGAPNGAGTHTPERYLRLLLEDELPREGPADRLAGALAALAASGLDPAVAAEVAADAGNALALRDRPPFTSARPSTGDPGGAPGSPAHGLAPGERWLWHLITRRLAHLLLDGSADRAGDAGPAVAALVACGVLAADDPVAAQSLLLDDVALGLGDEDALDPRIRSVLDARDHLGRAGAWEVGAGATVDGAAVTIQAVRATDAEVTVVATCDPEPWPADLDLTATDDRGGWYVGRPEPPGWVLVPSLDPEAAQLRLAVTGPTQAAAWTVDL